MAEGGGDRDNPFSKDFRRPRVERQLSRDDIGNQARYLLSQFIHDRMEIDGLNDVPSQRELVQPETPTGPPVGQIQGVANALKRIGDELDGDDELQRLMSQLQVSSNPRDTFLKVAKQMFSDGQFNWGRVVTLFYFAYKLALKALRSAVGGSNLSLVWDIIDWVVHFIVDNVAHWILDRGGWEAIQEYFGTPSGQFAGVLLAGILSGLAITWWKGL